MINLSLPSSAEKYYAIIDNALIGPFRLDGTVEIGSNSVSYRGVHDSLQQGSSNYHENNVTHVKTEGTFSYVPELADIVTAPTGTYPKQISWKAVKASNGAVESKLCRYGRVETGASFGTLNTLDYTYKNITFVKVSNTEYIQYTVTAQSGSTSRAVVRKDHFTLKTATSTNTYFSRKTSNDRTTTTLASSWRSPRSHAEIVDLVEKNVATMAAASDWSSGGTWTTYSSPSFSMTQFRSKIDSLSRTLIEDISFPISDRHYGDLAMDASQKVNANQTNMIAFLRDLRRPKEMIPKLKNLMSIRGNASNFLAVDYGLLPTIDDIRRIIEAFQRVEPYLDKHGFQTYNAVSQDSAGSGNLTYSLEQRIKIAIENEDSGLKALGQKVHSAGFALTLQNVWDLIPYSFVLDWFIDIGGFLERCDTRMRLMELNIKYATMSNKKTTSLVVNPTVTSPISGTLSVVRYQRWTDDHCPEPPLISSSNTDPLSHWLNGSALILQRQKY